MPTVSRDDDVLVKMQWTAAGRKEDPSSKPTAAHGL
jgi:hypothetical protein